MKMMGIDEDFSVGSVIKYLYRYKYKGDPIGDLEKAKEYIDFLIEKNQPESGAYRVDNLACKCIVKQGKNLFRWRVKSSLPPRMECKLCGTVVDTVIS
jgi:hypothetical protein